MTNQKAIRLSGIVTARNCPTCGHHEIGLVSDDGVFHPLRTGSRVLLVDDTETERMLVLTKGTANISQTGEKPANALEGRYWIPEPLRGDRRMRLKYGVVIGEEAITNPMNGQVYQSAFLQKLTYLLDKEMHTPIAVLLDRFFVAPHLASGETKDIVMNMWEELDEIRRPLEQITDWLEKQDEKSLGLLVQPNTLEDLENNPVGEATALEELRTLDLEEFLSLL